MNLKVLFPELNPNQYNLFKDLILEIIGEDIDTQALVRNRERELAKYGFEINAEKKAQRIRLNELFGIPEPPEPDNRWWLKGHDHE